MRNAFVTAGAALIFGGLAFTGPAQAPPLRGHPPRHSRRSQEVWHDLRPDVTPPPAAVGEGQEPPKETGERPKSEEGSGDVENQEIWHDLETGVTPPPGE